MLLSDSNYNNNLNKSVICNKTISCIPVNNQQSSDFNKISGSKPSSNLTWVSCPIFYD